MKRSNMYWWGVLVLAVLLGLTACGGGSKNSQAAMTTQAYDMEVAAQETMANNAKMAAPQPMAAEGAMGTNAQTGLTDTASMPPSVKSGRKLIRNVSLSVETNGFDQLLQTLTSQVGELGGYMEQSDISGNSLQRQNEPPSRYASLTVRIPIDKVDGFIATVEKNGNVINKSESTQDVTLQYSDLESRKKSLTVEQDRIWALLEKADTLEAVIALEERLSEIRYELESMESQLRLYDNQVEYSMVHISIDEIRDPASFTPTEPVGFAERIQKGFTKNLKSMSQGMTDLIIGLAASSPFWVPLALIAAAVIVVARRKNRKYRETFKAQVPQEKGAEQEKGSAQE